METVKPNSINVIKRGYQWAIMHGDRVFGYSCFQDIPIKVARAIAVQKGILLVIYGENGRINWQRDFSNKQTQTNDHEQVY